MNEQLEYFYKGETSNPDFLIFWLHGLGADGYDFEPLCEVLEIPMNATARFIFPHASYRPITVNQGMNMRGWYDIYSLDRLSKIDEKGIDLSCRMLSDLIEAQQKETGIPYSRIFVGGFSQGGAIAFHLGLRFPIQLAGICGLSTYILSPEDILLQRNPANKTTPVFIAHGVRDPVVPYSLGKKTEEILDQIQQPYIFHSHHEEHNVPVEILKCLSEWFYERTLFLLNQS